MKLIALLSWYDEHPGDLHRAVASVAPHVDQLVALDGAYALYPGRGHGASAAEQHAAIRAAAGDTPFSIHPHTGFRGNEVEKRSALFALGERHATEWTDWYVVLDADEEWVHVGPNLRWELEHTQLHVASAALSLRGEAATMGGLRKLFRAIPGLRVREYHWAYVAPSAEGDIHLWGAHEMAPALDLANELRIVHHHRASVNRALAGRRYYTNRDKRNIERWR